MSYPFRWNVYTDQPHNVLPRYKRFTHHLKYLPGYFQIVNSNLAKATPVLSLYREYRKKMYTQPVSLHHFFALSVSPGKGEEKKKQDEEKEKLRESFKELGINQTLVRIPSWERERLSRYEEFIRFLHQRGLETTVALLQNREDVLRPSKWVGFVEEVFSCLGGECPYFEVGHAWNRAKWGVWDFREYLNLVRPLLSLAKKYRVKLVGPAVIDFEFHLYPPVLKQVSFDKVSSLLYVDRMGAPENKQFGWDLSRKIALLKAVVDGCLPQSPGMWITEVNWPLAGTDKYSPAAGKPNVSEEEQADYLVRYYLLCLASGMVERVYWWQLAAPGYGLVDNREGAWRERKAYTAFKAMVKNLQGSQFIKDISPNNSPLRIFLFQRQNNQFVVCWSTAGAVEYNFYQPVGKVISRDGKKLWFNTQSVPIGGSPLYVYFGEKRG